MSAYHVNITPKELFFSVSPLVFAIAIPNTIEWGPPGHEATA